MVKVLKNTGQPFHLQIKEWLQDQIASGKLSTAAPLPDERTLAKRLGTSRVTVRRALKELTSAGYFDRVRGRGTFLRAAAVAHPSARIAQFAVVAPLGQAEMRQSFFYYRILEGLLEACGAEGTALLFRTVTPPFEAFAEDLARDSNVSGLVIMGIVNQTMLKMLARVPKPKVLVDSAQPEGEAPCDSVTHAGTESSFQAVSHLLDLGHRRIGLMTYGPTPASLSRRSGYERALAARGQPLAPELVYPVECNSTSAYATMRRILSEGSAPTALYCTTDEIALGALSAAKDHGLRVPRDLSIVGFGDLGYFCHPALSSVRIPLETMGRKAAELLRARVLRPGADPCTAEFSTEFVPRATSDVPPTHAG